MTRRLIALATVLFSVCITASAQALKTGYFIDSYLYGTELNPALQPAGTQLCAGVAVGSIGLGALTNVGVSDFFFPLDGELVTGLNKEIPEETFLGGLNEGNRANVDMTENLLSVGFRSGSGRAFNTISLNLKSSSALSIPKSVFEFLKVGGNEDVYNIEDVSLSSRNYIELSYGYSRAITDAVTVGVALKGLAGLAYLDMDVDRLTLDTSGDEVVAAGTGTITGSIPELDFNTYESGCYDFSETVSTGSYFNGSYGLAMDLGVVVTPVDGLSVSAALTDLGFISWKNTMEGAMGSTRFSLADNEDIQDNLQDMFMFRKSDVSGKTVSSLNAKANIGARYQLPFAQMLSVGALCSFRLGDTYYRYADCRAGLTFTPGRMFSLAASAGYGTYGFSAGGAANLKLSVVNLFAGIDGVIVKVNRQHVPVNPVNTVAKFGLSICIGQ